jgi:hypothetical protein
LSDEPWALWIGDEKISTQVRARCTTTSITHRKLKSGRNE